MSSSEDSVVFDDEFDDFALANPTASDEESGTDPDYYNNRSTEPGGSSAEEESEEEGEEEGNVPSQALNTSTLSSVGWVTTDDEAAAESDGSSPADVTAQPRPPRDKSALAKHRRQLAKEKARSAPVRGNYRSYTLELKEEVLAKLKRGIPVKVLADFYSIKPNTISTWKKKEKDIYKAIDVGLCMEGKKSRTSRHPRLDKALMKWFNDKRYRVNPAVITIDLMIEAAQRYVINHDTLCNARTCSTYSIVHVLIDRPARQHDMFTIYICNVKCPTCSPVQ